MNFGSAWIKKADQSREVILYGKNFPEAQAEDFGGVFKFRQLTEIVLDDLRVFPFICADALETPVAGGGPTVSQRIARQINLNHRPAICVGSLLQPSNQASEKWTAAISRLIHELGEASAALVICNVATAGFDVRAGGEIWRNLSGVYVSKRMQKKGQKEAQESASYFESDALMGWPLRSTIPQVAFGTLSLPPYKTDSGILHPWNASPTCARYEIVDREGERIQAYKRSGLLDETVLLTEVTHCSQSGVALKFNHIADHIKASSQDVVNTFVARLLGGPLGQIPKLWNVSELCDRSREALAGSFAYLDAVMEASSQAATDEPRFSWAPNESAVGETIRLCAPAMPVAIWWSGNELTPKMLAELRNRAEQFLSGDPLQVFGRGADGDFDPTLWADICSEIAVSPEHLFGEGGAAAEYADLSTVEATSFHHVIKAKGMQPLTCQRCLKSSAC